ncbi:sporulation integral membrane protein YtvI [Oceanivirga miroungae]|uniref:Sporulation integral membrane protein YtvI n=1 Tax=Oceanivirga miroungae TaxID=1130046 RepID=A0A6I8MC74_9FUSO|nr:sporulation integral membrane protein YtvI [Oceanivirga miroungae]VWL85825.1 sporulation integral membrane protein YtvI [Oceanivirga miroungae]
MGEFNIKKFNGIFYVVSVLILLFLVFKISIYLLPFVFSLAIVAMVNPIIKFIKNKLKIDNNVVKILVLLIFYLTIGALIVWAIVSIIIEGYKFSLYILDNQNIVLSEVKKFLASINSEYIPKSMGEYITSLLERIVSFVSKYVLNTISIILSIIKRVPNILIFIIIMIISSFIIISDENEIEEFLKKQVPSSWLKKYKEIKEGVLNVLVVYIKAQIKLILLCFVELFIGFSIINLITHDIEYILLYAFVICIVDALPLVGAVAVMVPWSIISFINSNYLFGTLILVLSFMIWATRQILEPKLISGGAKMHPLVALIAIYLGMRFFGLIGVLIGPIILSILKIVFYEEIKYGFVKFLVGDNS